MGVDKRIRELQGRMEDAERTMQMNDVLSNHQAQYERALAQKMAEEQDKAMNKAMKVIPQYMDSFKVAGTGAYYTNSSQDWRRGHGGVVANKTTFHGDGFFSDIRICQDDYIRFKLFRGGWFCKLLFKLGWREPRDEDGFKTDWKNISNQSNSNQNLEVNLGKTYLKIDEMIAVELEAEEHEDFIRKMAKTDPENLKMIAGLKTLDDGMNAPLEEPTLNGNSQPMTSGAITIAKAQASASMWNAGQDAAIALNGQEVVRVDPSGNYTFGDKMSKAIKKVVETGKAP
jgi:hypothetical protein